MEGKKRLAYFRELRYSKSILILGKSRALSLCGEIRVFK